MNRISDLVPAHYREYYPRFITFLEKYQEWLYRNSGLTESEIDDLRNDTSWLKEDIDKFIETGQLKYFDPAAEPELLEQAIGILDKTVNPGKHAANLRDNFLMEGDFNGSATTQGDEAPDTNDPTVELSTVENNILDGWFNSMGFDRIKRNRLKSFNNLDQVLMISVLKHMYATKGTEASIRLFFSLMFEEDVIIFQPKKRIAVADEQFVLDEVDAVLRDDEVHQEYSYIIVVKKDVDEYSEIFDTVYKGLFHPSGFRVGLVKFDAEEEGLTLEDGGFLLIEPGVYLDII